MEGVEWSGVERWETPSLYASLVFTSSDVQIGTAEILYTVVKEAAEGRKEATGFWVVRYDA